MSEHLIVSPSTIYFATAVILGIGTIILALLSIQQSGHTRKMLFVATVPAASMAVAYVFMGAELFTVKVTAVDRQQSVARFVGYTLVLGALIYLERDLLDISWGQSGFIYALLLITPWTSLFSWVTVGAVESVMNLLAILAYLAGTYVLFGPHTRHAQSVSGERRLLFAKLRNLFVLSLGTLILLSATSEQSLGLMDFFVGQIGASYADLIFMLGVGGLAYSNKDVFEQTGPTTDTDSSNTDSQTQRSVPSGDA